MSSDWPERVADYKGPVLLDCSDCVRQTAFPHWSLKKDPVSTFVWGMAACLVVCGCFA